MGEQENNQRVYDKLDDMASTISDMRVEVREISTKFGGLACEKLGRRIEYLEKRDEVFAWKVIGSILTAVAAVAMTILQFFLVKMGK